VDIKRAAYMATNIVLAILSGVLGFLAFPPFSYDVLAWVYLVPLLFAIKDSGPRQKFFLGYITGLIFFGSVLYWLNNVSIPGTIILTLVLALFYGIFSMIAGSLMSNSRRLYILPFLWVVLEFLRGNLLSGFPWALIGLSQYTNIVLIQISNLTGVYGVSFIITLFNIAAFDYVTHGRKKIYGMMAALFLILAALIYGNYIINAPVTERQIKLGVVQGNIPQTSKWDGEHNDFIINEYSDLTEQCAEGKPGLIIWPETAYPYLIDINNRATEIETLTSLIDIPILAGVVYREDNKYYNSAVLFEKERIDEATRYDKKHLVPFGEYIPFEKLIAFLRAVIDKPIGDYAKGDEYVLFRFRNPSSRIEEDGTITRITGFYKFSVLICFEDIFAYISRDCVNKGADFLVNMTNDAWFGKTDEARQHLQASVFRAVENHVPVIRAANTGISCFIDPVGRITSRIEENGQDIMVKGYLIDHVNVQGGRKTFYTRYGDIFVYLCGIILLLFFVLLINKKNQP
jgi:apolipoprotein N-acyltransferase